MANGFPEGKFRIVNKATGVCIASRDGGQTHGVQAAVTARGETGVLGYSHTDDRQFTVHDKVKNIEEELWYFDSHADSWGYRVNMLYNKVKNIRSSWVLAASVEAKSVAYTLLDKDLENFLKLLPKQDEQTLAHLRTSEFRDITRLLETFIRSNGEETIKSELIGKLDDKQLDDYLNILPVYDSLRGIEQKFQKIEQEFQEYGDSSPFLGLNIPELEGLFEHPSTQPNEQLYKIIVAAVKLNMLHQGNLRLNLGYQDINHLLEKLKKENLEKLQNKVQTEVENVENPQKEAVKIIQELSKALNLSTNEKTMNTAKNILQTGLKSKESFEQLQTALKSIYGKKLQAVNWYSGAVFLQGAGRQEKTKWAFEDGYIFVEGQPDAVLAHSWGSSVDIRHRSDDPRQRWEFK